MHFTVADVIAGVSAAQFEPLFFAEDVNIALCAALGMERTLLEHRQEAGCLHRRVTIRPERDIPAALRPVLRQVRVEYTEEMVWRHGSGRGDWRIVPNIFTDKVTAAGSVRFLDHPEGTERVVEGDVTVRMLGLGGIAERFIVEDIERSFHEAARLTVGMLPKGLAARTATSRPS